MKKIKWHFFVFFPIAIGVAVGSFAFENAGIKIEEAEEVVDYDLETPLADMLDASDAPEKFSNDMAICHADEVNTIELETPDQDLLDAGDAPEKFSNDMAICHADEVITIDLEPVEIPEATAGTLSKTPVLFVPGLLNTKISDQSQNFLWIDMDRTANPLRIDSYTDSFMDPLSFSYNLLPSDNSLLIKNVIAKETYAKINYDYSQGLVDEFEGAGYNAVEGSADQTFYSFPYDWRYGVSGKYPDNKTNSDLLGEKIEALARISPTGKVDVVAHSLGGLIAKKYAMDHVLPKIGKLVFVGVPNLGSPLAAKALLIGHDFKIFGLNSEEIKKISQNMPAAYDLLPGQSYFAADQTYIADKNNFLFPKNLDYGQTDALLRQAGLNGDALNGAFAFNSAEFADYDVTERGIDAYNIIGCKSPTPKGLNYILVDGIAPAFSLSRATVSGDDTVPQISAQSLKTWASKTFFALAPEHGKMPSANGIRQKIVNFIAGSNLETGPAIVDKYQIEQNPNLCELRLMVFIALSPVDIYITDQTGKVVLGPDADGNFHYEIPGGGFEYGDGHQYVFLPADNWQNYTVNIKGKETGNFTLIKKEIIGEQESQETIFKDVPATADFMAKLQIAGDDAKIITNAGQEILPQNWFRFEGFFSPVKMEEANLAKAGSVIPLKFKLFHNQTESTGIADIVKIDFTPLVCSNNAINEIADANMADTGNLRYDIEFGQFIYNWKTPKTAGCWRAVAIARDGTRLEAEFVLK